jgi:N utilization substance protein B
MAQINKRQAREFCFQFFYQIVFLGNKLEQGQTLSDQELKALIDDNRENLPQLSPEFERFSLELIESSIKNHLDMKSQVQSKLKNWTIERINQIDIVLIYLAIAEMNYLKDPSPAPVVINEYIELAKKYGSEDSSKFINGIIDQFKN